MQKTYYSKLSSLEGCSSQNRPVNEEVEDWTWESNSRASLRFEEEPVEMDSLWSIGFQVLKDFWCRVWITVNYNGFDDDFMAPVRTSAYGSASGRF